MAALMWTNEGGDRSLNNPLNWREGFDVWDLTGAQRLPLSSDTIVDYAQGALGPNSGTCPATFYPGSIEATIANCTIGAIGDSGASVLHLTNVTIQRNLTTSAGLVDMIGATNVVYGNVTVNTGDFRNCTIRGNATLTGSGIETFAGLTVHGTTSVNLPGVVEQNTFYGLVSIIDGYSALSCNFYSDLTVQVRNDAPFAFSLCKIYGRLRLTGGAGDLGWLHSNSSLTPAIGPTRIRSSSKD